ncbi:MAG: 3-hydroxyacyl-CoA dehydrogenase family protein [Hyphomonadaceae bacterium]|nr:3-hydroxyacyl-CoA dehydrogenase family protein [Hyphomonadaceae bacterium]
MSAEIRTIGVCGAGGAMGAGIAIVTARAGFRTLRYDVSQEALQRAEANTVSFLGKSVERGKMQDAEREAMMSRLVETTEFAALADCDLIIEGVYEDLGVKQRLFAALDEACPSHTIFASNTSTLSITEIAAGCGRPDRVVGMHFCLPAQLMRLIEMSPGLLTAEDAFAAAWRFAEQCGQTPVRTQDKPGFILNALLIPFNNDAIRAVEAGLASATDIDIAVRTGLGYKMGPLELLDLIGLDTQVRLCEALYAVTRDQRAAAPPLLRRMVAAGLLGRKTGRGFHTYDGSAMFGA